MTARCAPRNALSPSASPTPRRSCGAATHSVAISASAGGTWRHCGRTTPTGNAAGLYRAVGIPVVEGLAAFHRSAYAKAVELLLPVRFDLWQIGGSHAQRDVVDWTLTEAAVRAGQRDVALSFAHE